MKFRESYPYLKRERDVYINERMVETVAEAPKDDDGRERCRIRTVSGEEWYVLGDADYVYRKLRVEMRREDGQSS